MHRNTMSQWYTWFSFNIYIYLSLDKTYCSQATRCPQNLSAKVPMADQHTSLYSLLWRLCSKKGIVMKCGAGKDGYSAGYHNCPFRFYFFKEQIMEEVSYLSQLEHKQSPYMTYGILSVPSWWCLDLVQLPTLRICSIFYGFGPVLAKMKVFIQELWKEDEVRHWKMRR